MACYESTRCTARHSDDSEHRVRHVHSYAYFHTSLPLWRGIVLSITHPSPLPMPSTAISTTRHSASKSLLHTLTMYTAKCPSSTYDTLIPFIRTYVRTRMYAYSAWCSRYYSVTRLWIAISSTAVNSDDFERMYTDTMTGCEDASRFVVISLFAARVTVCHRQSRDDDDAAAEFDAQR